MRILIVTRNGRISSPQCFHPIKFGEENIQEARLKSQIQHHILPLRSLDAGKQLDTSPCQAPTEVPAAPC